MADGERHQITQHGFGLLLRQVMTFGQLAAICLSVTVICGAAFTGGAFLAGAAAFFAGAVTLAAGAACLVRADFFAGGMLP
jgi:hypothetical protein